MVSRERRMTRWVALSLSAAIVACCLISPLSAQDAKLPDAFNKQVPETVEDLKTIQGHVRDLLKKLIPCTVGIRIGAAQGSGVILKDGYVLTAGHVSGNPKQKAQIILHDGTRLQGVTMGRNSRIDSGLIKITSKGDFPYADMGRSGTLERGDWCLAIGHPGGYRAGRPPVVRVGRVLDSNFRLIRTDCKLVGGDSGGPLFDMHGNVIGIHSRIGGQISANIHVPVDTYRDTWDRLVNNEEFGDPDVYLGVKFPPRGRDCKITEVTPNSPADKAGLKVDDVVVVFDGQIVSNTFEMQNLLLQKRPNQQVVLKVRRGDEFLIVRLMLTERPKT